MSVPLGATTAPRYGGGSIRLAPLGVPLDIALAHAGDAMTVVTACHGWEGQPMPGTAPMGIRLERGHGLSGMGQTTIRVLDGDLRIFGAGVEACADARTRTGLCAISNAYLRAPDRLREDVLEPLVLFLLTRNGRVPIHASGFIAGDLAILAAGPSGAGKSCLALAADAARWPVLSDDTVYLQQQPAPRIWGWPGAAHLLPGDCPHPVARMRIRGGRLKYAVPLQAAPIGAAGAARAVLCVLARGETAALEPLEPADAMRRLAPLEPGFDLLAVDIAAGHRLLTRKGAWLLTLSADPSAAIALLAANLPRLRATAFP